MKNNQNVGVVCVLKAEIKAEKKRARKVATKAAAAYYTVVIVLSFCQKFQCVLSLAFVKKMA